MFQYGVEQREVRIGVTVQLAECRPARAVQAFLDLFVV